MNKDREERIFKFNIKLRKTKDGKEQIIGYAAVFNKLSEDLGGFRERIAPGTFKRTINQSDIRGLFNHDPNFVLGRNKAGTLKLEENRKGLKIWINPPQTQLINDLVLEPMRRGDINQMSFGFKTIKDTWIQEENKETIRELNEVKLYDISPVTFPAYPQTSVAVRGFKKFQDGMEEKKEEKGQNIEILKKKLEIEEIILT